MSLTNTARLASAMVELAKTEGKINQPMKEFKAIQERTGDLDKLEITILLIKSEALLSIEKKLSIWLDALASDYKDGEGDTEYVDTLYKEYNTYNREIRLLLLNKYGIEL